MRITIKTLGKPTFYVDFDPENTVLQLKQRIKTEWGKEYDVDRQNLIYAGLVLTDDKTIQSYYVNEEIVIVVILINIEKEDENKLTTTNKYKDHGEATSGKQTSLKEPSEFDTKGEKSRKPVKSELMGDRNDLKNISTVDLEIIQQASRETFINNPGSNVDEQESDTSDDETYIPLDSNLEERDILVLFSSPPFQKMRSLIRRNPEHLIVALQQIYQSNPEVYQFISGNQDLFMNWLNEDVRNQSHESFGQKTDYWVSCIAITLIILFMCFIFYVYLDVSAFK